MSRNRPDFDPYVVLGVDKNSSASDIKTAYRKLVLKCHPDKIPDESLRTQAVDHFQKVQESYEILSDDSRRLRYDQEVHLEKLRNEVKAQKASADSYSSSRPAANWQYRDGRRYEDRVPADAAFFTDSDEPHYFEEPSSYSYSQKYSDTAKRPHTKVTEEKKKTKAPSYATPSPKATKQTDRDSTRATHNTRDKIRTKERRRDASSKHEQAFAFSDSEGYSDVDGYWTKPSKLDSDPRYAPRGNPSRSSKMGSVPSYAARSRDYPSDSESAISYSDDEYEHESKLNSQEHFLKQYIKNNKEPSQDDRRHRSPKHSSYDDRDRRHSERSDRDSTPRHSTRAYSKPENVYTTEQPPHHSSSRRSHERLGSPSHAYERERAAPSMPAKSSSYRGSSTRAPPPVTRSATVPYPPRTRQGSTRSESNVLSHLGSMVAGLKGDTVLPSRSRPRGADRNDSGYSSGPSTPEMSQGFSGSSSRVSRFKIVEPSDTDRDTITVEPIESRYRDQTPPMPRAERASTSGRSRAYVDEPEVVTVRPAAVSSKSSSSARAYYREVKPDVFHEKRYRQAVH